MGFELIWRYIWALPGLLLPGLTFQPAQDQPSRPAQIRTATPAPSRSAAPKPAPKLTRTPTATPVTTAAKTEIASEQVCPGQSEIAKTVSALTCLTRNARVFHGLSAVAGDSALMAAASAKAQDMLRCGYGHTACGRAFNYWITNKGYDGRCSGENIARGQRSPREVFVAWMNSAGHRANILNSKYKDLGVAELGSSQGPLWVMELGGC